MDKTLKEIVIGQHEPDDVSLALRAAVKMAELFREPFCILQDLSVVKLSECDEPPLEIIRHDESQDWRYQ
jgi:hypothetical protein